MNCYSPTPARREHETDCDGARPIDVDALIDHVRESPLPVALAIREWFAGNPVPIKPAAPKVVVNDWRIDNSVMPAIPTSKGGV